MNKINNQLGEEIIETRYKIVSLQSPSDIMAMGVVVEEKSFTATSDVEVMQWAAGDLEEAMKAICENAPDKFSVKHIAGNVSLPDRF